MDHARDRNGHVLFPGDYIRVPYHEEAIFVELWGSTLLYRYEAERCVDGKTIWVLNGDCPQDVRLLREGDERSEAIPLLKGPYGED